MTGIGLAQPKPKPDLLRPRQIANAHEEIRRIDDMLAQPQHVLQNVDVPAAIKQRNALNKQLAELTPQPFAPEERDAAVRKVAELEEGIKQGMCTAGEMRRNPPGAVDKHRSWERRKKPAIREWQRQRLRMHVSGMLGDDVPEDATDVANVEKLRPVGGSGEMNLDVAQIVRPSYFLPEKIASQNHASDEDRQRWTDLDSQLLAEFAAKGEPRAKASLIRILGEEPASALIATTVAKMGVPAQLPTERTTKPSKG